MPTPHPSDKLALSALARTEDTRLFDRAAASIKTSDLGAAFRQASRLCNQGGEGDVAVVQRIFVKAHMIKTSEYFFGKHIAQFLNLPVEEVFDCAATPRALNKWVGKGPDAAHRKEDLARFALEDHARSAKSTLALWFIESCPLDQLPNAVPCILQALSPRPYSTPQELLSAALKRDASGNFLAQLIHSVAETEGSFERLTDLYSVEDGLFEVTMEPLVSAAANLPGDIMTTFATAILSAFGARVIGRADRKWSATLLGFAAVAMSRPDSEGIRSLLTAINAASLSRSIGAEGGDGNQDICGIRYLPAADPDSFKITERGARLLTLVIEHIRQGQNPLLSFEAAALNLGMTHVASPGQFVVFDPQRHEDTVGGLIRGTEAAALSSGWELRGCIIERAKVKPV